MSVLVPIGQMTIARKALADAEAATPSGSIRARFCSFETGAYRFFDKQPAGSTANVYVRADVSGHMLASLSRQVAAAEAEVTRLRAVLTAIEALQPTELEADDKPSSYVKAGMWVASKMARAGLVSK